MNVKRVERIWIKPNKNINNLSHKTKKLYNFANYLIRQEFIRNKRWIRYNELDKLLKENDTYKQLPAQTSQQILKLLDRDWKSFFRAMKEWKKQPKKFKERPKIPKYKKSNYILLFTNQQCEVKDKILKFPKKVNLEVKTRLENVDLREVRIIPKGIGYWLEIIYEKEIEERNNLDKNKIVGLDIGLNNLVTIVDNIGNNPIIIKGGIIKSVNQYYNKKRAELRAYYDTHGLQYKEPKRIKKLTEKRNRKIRDIMHKTSKWIINYCVDNNIGTTVIGHNNGWKQNINLGKHNNQNFVSVPFNILIQQIRYKAEEKGIDIKLINESHTSKCSFLDNEPIEHRECYIGSRVSRGLYRSGNGKIVNADVNAGYNLIKKAVPKAFADGIEGVGLHPIRIDFSLI